jgi:molybdenum cofactor cytidylyltransferase
MGQFKQLLPFGAKTFVECCVDNLLASRVDDVLVVTGHRASDVREAIGDRPVRLVHNADYQLGMSESIKRGVSALTQTAGACLIALVDQPQVQPAIVNRIIEAYEEQHPLIIVPVHEGRNGHPVLIDLSLRDDILTMDPTIGLRQVVRAHEHAILRIEVESADVLTDFDLPDDYGRLVQS